MQHTLYRFMLFLVKGKVELDEHDGQHQQSNSCEGDEETCRQIRSFLMFNFCIFIVWRGAEWAVPKDSAVPEGEEGWTLALGCVICLVGDVMVVAVVVVNSSWV